MNYIYKDLNNKESKVINTYIDILKKNNNKSSRVMILVPNNICKLRYEKDITLEYSEFLNITTYINFIKKELLRFWPIVLDICDEIKVHNIKPRFINSTLTDYLISNNIRYKREKEGYFEEIIGTNKSISSSIIANINKASLNLMDFDSIGEKIYLSKKNMESINRFSYSEMNEIIMDYTTMLLSRGMLDNSLCVYIYNNYLLKSEIYNEFLEKEIKYLIVDSLESSQIAELEFIKSINSYIEESHVFYNSKKDFAVFNNVDTDEILNYIHEEYKGNKNEFRNNISIGDIYSMPANIELSESSQLYNEMIQEVIDKVRLIISEGAKKEDIVIISPTNNTVLDYKIKNGLKNYGIEIFNTKKDKKLIDYPYARALIVGASIFYSEDYYIKEEDYINFIQVIFAVNRIKALTMYKQKDENEDIKNIIKYINDKKDKGLKISEFLVKFYIDKMLILEHGKENIGICKKIIYECETFIENIEVLDIKNEKEKLFIEALKTTINDYYQGWELEEIKNLDKILITTPYTYISSGIKRQTHIWLDVGSNSWSMKIEKDISNLIVLRKSFEMGKVYTDIMEDEYKKYYLYNTIYNLLLDTKNVYAYKSEYTVNGYIQESILYSMLVKILDKEGYCHGQYKL